MYHAVISYCKLGFFLLKPSIYCWNIFSTQAQWVVYMNYKSINWMSLYEIHAMKQMKKKTGFISVEKSKWIRKTEKFISTSKFNTNINSSILDGHFKYKMRLNHVEDQKPKESHWRNANRIFTEAGRKVFVCACVYCITFYFL